VLKFGGMTFFAINFLNLTKTERLFFIGLLVTYLPIGIMYIYDFYPNISMYFSQIIAIYSIYIGIKSYIRGTKTAVFYIIAIGISNICFIGVVLMVQGYGIEYSIVSLNLPNFAIIWDLIAFSLALSFRIKILQQQKALAEHMLQARSRFTTLGETIGSIAHQWRQPLTELSLINNYINAQLRFNGQITKDELLKSTHESDIIIKKLSSIIDMFYNFFDNNIIDEKFELSSVISDVVEFMRGQFDANDIACNIKNQSSCVIAGNKEEFFQAFLNILTNAKDAFMQNKISEPAISINLGINEINAKITVEDNGGGIKIYDIQKIFEPYVSSKGLNGMGIGLFITKNIIENKLQGTISATNSKDGAIFTMTLPIIKNSPQKAHFG
jgi:signal transduction histidine kinase